MFCGSLLKCTNFKPSKSCVSLLSSISSQFRSDPYPSLRRKFLILGPHSSSSTISLLNAGGSVSAPNLESGSLKDSALANDMVAWEISVATHALGDYSVRKVIHSYTNVYYGTFHTNPLCNGKWLMREFRWITRAMYSTWVFLCGAHTKVTFRTKFPLLLPTEKK
jgi:hypothetical protein